MRARSLAFVGAGLLFTAAGCRPDAVVEAIEINVGLSDNDIDNQGVLASEKNISTEQGNPYGAFLGELKANFGDEEFDNVFIQLDAATLTLEANGDAAHDDFSEVLSGKVDLVIVDETAGTETVIGSVTDPAGAVIDAETFEVNDAAFDDEVFQATLRAGSFKVKMVGTAVDVAGQFNVNVVVATSFSAFL